MLRLRLALLCLLACACEDPVLREKAESLGPEPGPYEEGPLHRAGQPCTWCHTKGGSAESRFDIAGTLYAQKGAQEPLWGATVRLFEKSGRQVSIVTNLVGTFYLGDGELDLGYPLWIEIEHEGKTARMKTPIFRETSCAACHRDPPSRSTVGHVYLEEEKP